MEEKRKFKRYAIGHDAVLVTQNTHEIYRVKARDISAQGICLVSGRPLPEYQACRLSIALGSASMNKNRKEYVEFVAKAVYYSENPGEYRYGLEMISIEPKYEQVLSTYLAWREANEK